MMLKNLEKLLESEKKDKRIFDIVIYGSAVKGKEQPNDVDILIIFTEGTLRDRLNKAQQIKSKVKSSFKDVELDVKQILLVELFSPEFFARTGIFLGGISVFKSRRFSETLGFRPFALFTYSLEKLSHTEKIKFNYVLSGRNAKGIIEQFGGKRIASGAVKMPLENALAFEDVLKEHKVEYERVSVLQEV